MKTAKGIIVTATLAATISCIAGPFDPPRIPHFYPPPGLNNSWQRIEAENERRQTEQMWRQQRDRDMRLLQQAQEDQRREKQMLENVHQSNERADQK